MTTTMIIKTRSTITRDPQEFCPIPENPLYLVNSQGKIFSTKRKQFMQIFENASGNPSVAIKVDGKVKTLAIHKILATIFIPNPNNYSFAYTIDGDKLNLSLDNINWFPSCRKGDLKSHAVKKSKHDF